MIIRKFENIPELDKSEQFTRKVSIPAHVSSAGLLADGSPGVTFPMNSAHVK